MADARNTNPERPWRRFVWIGAASAAALMAIAAVVYFAVGDLGLSVNGYIALIAGAVGTAAVAAGLMSLVFFSDRSGHDEAAGRPDEHWRRH